DAAAIAAQRRSPCSTPRWAMGISGIRNASTRTTSGRGASISTARRMALSDARWMLIRSISCASADATLHATARSRMRTYSSSRSAAGTALESHTPGMCRPGWRTTAAATTGPARQPRPTSSTPATWTKPTRRSAFSSVRIAGTRVMGSGEPVGRVGLAGRRSGRTDHLSCLAHATDLTWLGLRGVLHSRRLALQLAEVVQLRAADPRRPHHLDLLDRRRVQREDALDALAERHLANGERGARAAAVQTDHDAFEDLNALLVALAHLHVHADGVARLHRRPLGQLRFLHQLNRAHVSLL